MVAKAFAYVDKESSIFTKQREWKKLVFFAGFKEKSFCYVFNEQEKTTIISAKPTETKFSKYFS